MKTSMGRIFSDFTPSIFNQFCLLPEGTKENRLVKTKQLFVKIVFIN